MGDLTLRLFHDGDLPTLQKVRAAAFAPVFASFRKIVGSVIAPNSFANAEGEQADLLSALIGNDDTELWVVEADGTIAGFGAVTFHRTRKTGEIGLNAVHPDYAGAGLGTRLYEHLLQRMRAEGMTVAEVGTGGDASHAPARQAYAKAGFDKAVPSVALYRAL